MLGSVVPKANKNYGGFSRSSSLSTRTTTTNRLNQFNFISKSQILNNTSHISHVRNFSGTSRLRAERDFGAILEQVCEELENAKQEADQQTKEDKQTQFHQQKRGTKKQTLGGIQHESNLSQEDLDKFFNRGGKLNETEFIKYLQENSEDPDELSWALHNGLRGTEEEEAEEEKEFWENARKQRIGEPERDFVDNEAKIKGVKTSHIVSDYMPEMRKYFRCPSVNWETVEAIYRKNPDYRDAIIIDLREEMQVASTGKLPDSINLPMSLIQEGGLLLQPPAFAQAFGVAKPPYNKDLILVSVDPNAAELASIAFAMSGWFRVYNYREGMSHFVENLERIAKDIQEKVKDPENNTEYISSFVRPHIRELEREHGIRAVQESQLQFAHKIVDLYDSGDKETLMKLVTLPKGSTAPTAKIEITDKMIEEGVASARKLIEQHAQ